jgi:hypothetical protein
VCAGVPEGIDHQYPRDLYTARDTPHHLRRRVTVGILLRHGDIVWPSYVQGRQTGINISLSVHGETPLFESNRLLRRVAHVGRADSVEALLLSGTNVVDH